MQNTLLRLSMGLVLFAAVLARAEEPFSLKNFLGYNRDVQVVTLTEATPAGRELTPVSPAAPAYYYAKTLGFRQWGREIPGDRKPDDAQAVKMIQKVLAKQGYLPASEKHRPTLLLVFNWGTINLDRTEIPNGQADRVGGFRSTQPAYADPFPPSSGDGEPAPFAQMAEAIKNSRWGTTKRADNEPTVVDGRLELNNQPQIFRFLFGSKIDSVMGDGSVGGSGNLADGLTLMNNSERAIYNMIEDSLYISIVTAYDFVALEKERRKKLLWITKISCPSRGLTMAKTLPTMVAVGGPNIGRETDGPVLIRASEKFKPVIELSDPVVLEYIESGKAPVIGAPSGAAEKKR